jgi:squalene-associated FAD-dependent desaturase
LAPSPFPPPALAVIGGGLAGLAAAVAAVDRGLRVELFERANFLGGRAGSFVDSATGTLVDRCQHVVMGCCDELLSLCGHTALLDCFESTDTYHFIARDGKQWELAPVGWLPGPWRLLPGLLRLRFLSWRERWGIVGALRRLARRGERGEGREEMEEYGIQPSPLPSPLSPLPSSATFGQWLGSQRQSTGAIEGFWSPIVLSTLGETVGRASLAAVEKVFREGFLGSRRASRLLLPQRPLREIFHGRLRQWLADRGVIFHLGSPVLRVELGKGDGHLLPERPFGCLTQKATVPFSLVLRDGARRQFQWVIAAVSWRDVRRLLAEEFLAAMPDLAGAGQLEPAAIAAVHLWFDRPVIPLPHAALVGRLGQWVFARPCRTGVSPAPQFGAGEAAVAQQYCQVVISAAHRVGPYRHSEWLAEILAELGAIWPEVRQARLLHARVVAQPAALFSARPGADRLRPQQRTPIPNLTLAGDWTATGWPATLESAVRSGRRAVEALEGLGAGGPAPGP